MNQGNKKNLALMVNWLKCHILNEHEWRVVGEREHCFLIWCPRCLKYLHDPIRVPRPADAGHRICPECSGWGYVDKTRMLECLTCRGEGQIPADKCAACFREEQRAKRELEETGQ